MKTKKIIFSMFMIAILMFTGVLFAGCNEKKVASIYVDEKSTTYVYVGETFNTDNLIIRAKLNDKTEITISNDKCKFSTIDTSSAGSQTLTITYNTYSTNVQINVVEKLQSISFADGTVPAQVYQNDAWRIEGIVVMANYYDGSHNRIANRDCTFSPFDTSIIGKQTLTVTYGKFTITKEIDVVVNEHDTISSIELDKNSFSQTVYQNDVWETSSIIVRGHYDDDTYITLSNDDLTFSTIDTSTTGKQNLTVTYLTLTDTIEISIIEKASEKNYTVTGYSEPDFVTSYKANSQVQNTFTKTGSTGTKGFATTGLTYLVGNDNNFVYSPTMDIMYTSSDDFHKKDDFVKGISEYNATIKVYLVDAGTETDVTNGEYVTFDATKHTFLFGDLALNKIFKITIIPQNLTLAEKENITEQSFQFKVVDGYNVYSAADLSVFDNQNSDSAWTTLKSKNGIALDIKTTALIFQNDIKLTKNDIPSVHFWTEEEVAGASDADRVVGSLKNYDSKTSNGTIYARIISSDETFTIEGNYFKLDASQIPLMVRETSDTAPTEGTAIISYTTLFAMNGTDTETHGSYVINNLNMYGNSKKSEDSAKSGGIMFVKSESANVVANNNLSQCWYMSYMFRTWDDLIHGDNISVKLNKVNAFDDYNTLIYIQGIEDISIIDSNFIGAGGPVMICDHVGNDATTGAGGYPTNVKVTNSVLESWVAGSEGWFASFNATQLAGSIKALNALFTPYGRTILSSDNQKMNLIAVYKSSSVAGLTTSNIRGTFTNTDTTTYSNGLDLAGSEINSVKQEIYTALNGDSSMLAQMAIIQTHNGTYGVPGTSGWLQITGKDGNAKTFAPDQTKFATANTYVNLYLFNGMAAVLGLGAYSA